MGFPGPVGYVVGRSVLYASYAAMIPPQLRELHIVTVCPWSGPEGGMVGFGSGWLYTLNTLLFRSCERSEAGQQGRRSTDTG